MENNVFVGIRHGRLTVTQDLGRDAKGHHKFECRCDCGALAVLRKSHFYPSRRYCSRSCPLLSDQRLSDDLTGKRIGHWKVKGVVRAVKYGGRSRALWNCVCDCGAERIVNGDLLKDGSSQSCGCPLYHGKIIYKTLEEKREALRANARKYAYANPARLKAHKIKHDMQQSYATPLWLNKRHWREMDALYKEARRRTKKTGIAHQVDHIIPLQGNTVSGLHVPWNLQVITQSENVAKSNRYADLYGDVEN